MTQVWDAVVIGGGPAGSAFAATFARGGRRVVLLERDSFPRYHVGESLLGTHWSTFEALGVNDTLKSAGFVTKAGATFAWGRERVPWTVYYGDIDVPPAGLQVRRAEFDDILLRHAAASGVDVRQGCRVEEVLFEADRAVGVAFSEGGGARQEIRAEWVVDSTGDDSLIGKHLGLVELDRGLGSTAVWSYWEHGCRLAGRDRGNTLYVSADRGWFWYIPVDDTNDLVSVGIVLGSTVHGSTEPADDLYQDSIDGCEIVRNLLAGSRRVAPVRSATAATHSCSSLSGPGWILVGDAACATDPIMSSGVQFAVQHGSLAAHVISTILDDPASQSDALAYYGQLYRQNHDTFVRLSRNFYAAMHAESEDPEAPDLATGRETTPARVPQAAGPGDPLALLALGTGLSKLDARKALGSYLAGRAAAGGNGPPPALSQLGPAFLEMHFHTDQLRSARAQRIATDLNRGSIVQVARGVTVGDHFFLAQGDDTLQRRRAIGNRLGDRYAESFELTVLFAALAEHRPYGDVRGLVCRTLGLQRHPQAFDAWIELLADHALVEWGAVAGPPADVDWRGAQCAG